MPRSEWQVLIHDHHPGYIDRQTHESPFLSASRATPGRGRTVKALFARERLCCKGSATVANAAGATHYTGRTSSPGYHCNGKALVQERRNSCLYVGAVQIDRAVSKAVLAAIQPAAIEAALKAAEHLETDHDQALEQRRLAVERAQYEAERAERRYRVVEPEHRLVARGLEREWEQCLNALEEAQIELEHRERDRPHRLDDAGCTSGSRPGPPPCMGRTHHHGAGQEGVVAHRARGGHRPCTTGRRLYPPHPALEDGLADGDRTRASTQAPGDQSAPTRITPTQ